MLGGYKKVGRIREDGRPMPRVRKFLNGVFHQVAPMAGDGEMYMSDLNLRETRPSKRLAGYLSTAAVAAGGITGHAVSDIIGSTTPQGIEPDYSEGFFWNQKMRAQAAPTGVKFSGNGGRFAVNSTLQSGDTLSGYSFSAEPFSRLALFYGNTNYNSRISNYSSATSPTLAAGTHLIGIAFSGDLGQSFLYGWFDYTLTFDGSGNVQSFVVNSWAYNDTADEGILMGRQQSASASAVPGIGGLAALAMGAAGVRGRRRRVVA